MLVHVARMMINKPGKAMPAAMGETGWRLHVGVAGACLTPVMLKLTDNLNLQLVQYDKPAGRAETHPRVCDTGGHHLALRVADVEQTAAYLRANGCTVMEIIAIPEGPLAGKKNLYARDPF